MKPPCIDLTWVDTTWKSHAVTCSLRSHLPVHMDTWQLFLVRYHHPHARREDPHPWDKRGSWAEYLTTGRSGMARWVPMTPGQTIEPLLDIAGFAYLPDLANEVHVAVYRALCDAGISAVRTLDGGAK